MRAAAARAMRASGTSLGESLIMTVIVMVDGARRVAGAIDWGMRWASLTFALIARSLANPATGAALVRVAWRFRRRHWYRRLPFLPVPATDYLRWRMYTAYGRHDAVPPARDVIRYARWATRDP